MGSEMCIRDRDRNSRRPGEPTDSEEPEGLRVDIDLGSSYDAVQGESELKTRRFVETFRGVAKEAYEELGIKNERQPCLDHLDMKARESWAKLDWSEPMADFGNWALTGLRSAKVRKKTMEAEETERTKQLRRRNKYRLNRNGRARSDNDEDMDFRFGFQNIPRNNPFQDGDATNSIVSYHSTVPSVNDVDQPLPQRRFDFLERTCLLYTSPSPRDLSTSRMPSSA